MEVKIYIPKSLSDITLEQYQLYRKIQDDNDEEEIASRKMMSVFCKIPLSEVLNIEYSSVAEIMNSFEIMFSREHELKTTFTLGGVEFGFIPSIETISFGEYIDIESYMDKWESMHSAMAVLYRPITKKIKGDKYDIEKYISSITYADVMKAMPLDIVFGVNVFFWNLERELLGGLIDYLEVEMKTMDTKTLVKQLNLENGGDGISQYMASLKETLQNSTRSPNFHF